MNNRFRAAQLITGLYGTGFHNPQDLAKYLDETGLLAPDLPEPDRDTRDPKWQSEYREEYEYPAPSMWRMDSWLSVGVFPQDNDIAIWEDKEPLPPLSIAEARELAYALLAAANHSEEER